MDYAGLLFRALNPVWARDPFSGEGAARFGGRFNPRGLPALYTSLRPETAMREANQVGAFQPITLIAYRAEITGIVDATEPATLAALGLTASELADPAWRDAMRTGGMAPTQRLASDLMARGYCGLLVPSYASGAAPADRNLVLWRWGKGHPARLSVIDDEGRLTPNR